MFWQEEPPVDQFQIPNDVVDLMFDIDCRELPVDHAYTLAAAIVEALPWVGDDLRIGVHAVHGAGSQNGWERPEHGTASRLILSRRTRLTLRCPRERQADLERGLTGLTLEIGGCPMRVGKAHPKPLSKQTTLGARHVVIADRGDEDAFLEWAAAELRDMGIRVRKALCGRSVALATPDGPLATRSLMLAELSLDESLRLQQQGLGSHRALGCGIFLPHKGIGAVTDRPTG